MAKTQVINLLGEKVKDLTLNDIVWKNEGNDIVLNKAIRNQLDSQRQGTHKTKTRAEVSGGGKKPWKQKGTGRARAGSLRSPLFRGGGVIFGPKPRSFETNLPQKARKLALKSALSAKLDIITIVKDFSEISESKTKAMVKILKDLNAKGKVLIIADLTAEENKNLVLSARNIPSVKLLLPTNLNVKDLVEADTIIATEAAINYITERLAK